VLYQYTQLTGISPLPVGLRGRAASKPGGAATPPYHCADCHLEMTLC
jgi:hypothetical protein